MSNTLTFTTPTGDAVAFTVTAQADGSLVLYSQNYTTGGLFLRIFNTGSTDLTENVLPADLEEGRLYDIKAYTNSDFSTPAGQIAWTLTDVTEAKYTVNVDRRPLWVAGYATQTTNVDPTAFLDPNLAGGKFISGVTNTSSKWYRKTPLSNAAAGVFSSATTNGRIKWIDDNVVPAINSGFRRVQIINAGGHTNLNTAQTNTARTNDGMSTLSPSVAMQPHYPSLVYGSMELDNYKYFYDELDKTKFIPAPSPFTPSGQPKDINGNINTRGDSKKAWTAALTHLRGVVPNSENVEITSYQGYRIPFTDEAMTDILTDVTSLSAQSSGGEQTPNKRKAVWTGNNNSPGFCPEPGFDNNASGSKSPVNWVDKAKLFWDAEAAGLYSLGFDGIGLDTGTRVFDNAAGRANGSNHYLNSDFGTPTAPDGTVSTDLVDYFNGFGLKPMFEAVGLDTYNGTGGIGAAPDLATDRNKVTASWAFFGSWWGYEGVVASDGASGTIPVDSNMFGGTTTGGDPESVSSGGRVCRLLDNGALTSFIGNGSNKAKFPTTGNDKTEVHVIVQWNGTQLNHLMNGTGHGMSGTKVTWLGVRQLLWDMNDAGLIVSASGSTTQSVQNITPAEFRTFIMDLANGISSRPTV